MRPDSRPAAVCGSLFGLGVAIVLARGIRGAATAEQTPGFARAHGFSAHADLERFLLFVLLSIVGAWLSRTAYDRFARDSTALAQRLADPVPWFGLLAAPIIALLGIGLIWVLASSALASASLAILAPVVRSEEPDRAVVVPAIFAQTLVAWAFLARPLHRYPIPFMPMVIGLFALFTVFVIVVLKRQIELLAGSVLLLPVALWRNRSERVEVVAALFLLVAPFALSALRRFPLVAENLARALPVMLATSFVILGAAACLRSAPVANLFEDGHELLPASEYLAGRVPYRDIIPGHGLISDGLLQAAAFRLFGADYRGISRGGRLVGAFFWPLIFAMGTAATGKMEVGFWIEALSFLLFPQYLFLRVMASFGVLAAASFARRRPAVRAWFVTGALVPLALLWAVDFAFYSGVAVLAAVAVSEGRRWKNLASVAAGSGIAATAIGLTFAAFGIAKAFFQTTFLYLPKLAPAYTLGFPPLPESISQISVPDSLAGLGDPRAFYFWCLLLAVVAVGVIAARPAALSERGRAFVPFLAWFLAATLSVIERTHFGYPMFVAPAAIVLGARALAGDRGQTLFRRFLAASLLAWAVLVCRPEGELAAIESGLQGAGLSPEYVFPALPERVNGAAFRKEDANAVAAVGEFIRSRLRPGETWLDFTSTSAFYSYFDRRCPVRYTEVAFFETPEAEREVIRAVEENPRVRAVLVHLGPGVNTGEAIDGIPNRERAPLVWSYIEGHFHPSFSSPAAVFWERN